jgi:hypothetical protein
MADDKPPLQSAGEAIMALVNSVGRGLAEWLESQRPVLEALTQVASRPAVQAVIRYGLVMDHAGRPCQCLCRQTHPDDQGICEKLDAMTSRWYRSDLLGNVEVPLCAPCAAAQAAREFTGP